MIENLNDSDRLSNCNELLDWLDDAISAKEWEADMSQTQPSLAYAAKETVIGGVNIDFVAVKAEANSEPYEDNDGITHYSVFISEGIFTYDELSDFGVFGKSDESISWQDMKLLYHYMTTEDLRKLYLRFSGGSVDLKPFVDWLAEMIERDELVASINADKLHESGIWENLVATEWNSNDLVKVGDLRKANLSITQLEYAKVVLQEVANKTNGADDKKVLAWANEAIAAKNWQSKTPIVANGSLKYTIAVDAALVPVNSAKTLRAYKVADDGSLINRTLLAIRNGDDWMLTIESDSNSTYIVTYEQDIEWQNSFTDVNESNWYYDAVKQVNIKGIMNGVTATTFAPNDKVNRAMFVTVLYRIEGSPKANAGKFTDVKADAYYADAVAWASEKGIVNGVTKAEFAPNSNITREQIAAILYRYAQYKKYDVSVGKDTNILSFTDFDKISEYAIEALQYTVGSGIIKGKTESTLNPKDNATRAEIATMIVRFLEK